MSNGLNWTEADLAAHNGKTGKARRMEMQSERDFQREVVKRALIFGWKVYHTYDSRRSAPGFPDLVLVREHVIFAELKTAKGTVSKEQEAWIRDLQYANATVYVWRPGDLEAIVEVLR